MRIAEVWEDTPSTTRSVFEVTPHQLNAETVIHYINNFTQSLEISTSEKISIREQGYVEMSSIKDIGREALFTLVMNVMNVKFDNLDQLLSRITQANSTDLANIAEAINNWKTPDMTSVNVYIALIATKSHISKYIQNQMSTQLGEADFGQTVFKYSLDPLGLAKMIASSKRRAMIDQTSVREQIETANLETLHTLREIKDGTRVVLEVSPPIHSYQSKLMLRAYHLVNGVWQAQIISLPYLPEQAARLVDSLQKITNQAELTNQIINSSSQVEITDARDHTLQKVFKIDASKLDPENIMSLAVALYDPNINYFTEVEKSTAIQATIDAELKQAELLTQNLTSNILNIITDRHHLEQSADRLGQTLTVLNARAQGTDQLVNQGLTISQAESVLSTNAVQAAASGNFDAYVQQASGGKAVTFKSSNGDCVSMERSVGNSVTPPADNSRYKVGEVLSTKTDSNGLQWREIVNKDGKVESQVRCPSCGHLGDYFVDVCNSFDRCTNCKRTTSEIYSTWNKDKQVSYSRKSGSEHLSNNIFGQSNFFVQFLSAMFMMPFNALSPKSVES